MAKKCGPYMKNDEIYYLIPSKRLYEGLRRVHIIATNRFIDLYVLHGVDEPKIVTMIDANIPADGASMQETPKKKA